MTHNTHGGRRHGLSSNGNSRRFSVSVPDHIAEWIDELAAERSLSASEIWREMAENAHRKATRKKSAPRA